jgi:biotin carboxylase
MKVLVTGGAPGDLPIILAAKNLGLTVYSSGNRPNDVSHFYSDQYFNADYTNEEELLKVARILRIDAIVPSCHDRAVVPAAKVAKKLGLIGFDNPKLLETIHSKLELRKLLLKCKLPTIPFEKISNVNQLIDFSEKNGYPTIVKPVDQAGGIGISILENKSTAAKAFDKALAVSRSKSIIAEKKLMGSFHGASFFFLNGKIANIFYDDEFYSKNNFRVSSTIYPSTIGKNVRIDLENQISKFHSTYSLVDGILHVQFIETGLGTFIIEICRRTPGDLYPWFVEISSGFNLAQNHLLSYLPIPDKKLVFTHPPRFENVLRKITTGDVLPTSKIRIMNLENSNKLISLFNFTPSISFKIVPETLTTQVLFLEGPRANLTEEALKP